MNTATHHTKETTMTPCKQYLCTENATHTSGTGKDFTIRMDLCAKHMKRYAALKMENMETTPHDYLIITALLSD
jgi:hypothetical protein